MDNQSNDKNAADAQAAAAEAAEKAKAAEVKRLTAADAAKLVHRIVVVPPEKEGRKPTTQKVDIAEKEVLDFKDLGDRVCVVTVDGQKFYGDK